MTVHALYRFFDHGGKLLYVGITLNPSHRWADHRDQKPWWQEVAKVTLETHPDRASVLLAERKAIAAERPRHNIQHRSRSSIEPRRSKAMPGLPTEWPVDAMPDCCHDRCGIDAFYFPYVWDDGIARYMCQRGHAWKCYWGHDGSGTAPENFGVPFWKMGDPE